MRPLAKAWKTTGALLFVRASDDLSRTIDGVNAFLSYQPSGLSPGDDLLAVVQCDDVDSNPLPASGGHALRESVGLAGVWNLCSFDLTGLAHDVSVGQRRRRLLDAVSPHHRARHGGDDVIGDTARWRVLPVVSPAEALAGVEALLGELAAQHPGLDFGPTWFAHDPRRRELVHSAPRGRVFESAGDARRGAASAERGRAPLSLHMGTEPADKTF